MTISAPAGHPEAMRRLAIWSVGHSTHPLDALVALLRTHEIDRVADVRTVPRSRRHPHFRTEELARSLPDKGIAYAHIAALGGWRRPAADSANGGWRNRSFQGYADHAGTTAFRGGVDELLALAATARVAMMCSEALWWRCHRRLIADALVVAGHEVRHIGSSGAITEHELTPFAEVSGDRITYPPPAPGGG